MGLLALEGLEHITHPRGGLSRRQELLGPLIGASAIAAVGLRGGERPHREEQPEAEHDRDGPQLTDGEASNALIREHVPRQEAEIEASVGVTKVVEAEAVDAGIAGHHPGGDARQLGEVARGEVLFDLAELLLDDVGVVEQPLLCGESSRLAGAPRSRIR